MDIYSVLQDLGISYEEYKHPAVYTVKESDRLDLKIPGGRSKNLFLRNRAGDRHILVTAEASSLINLKTLAEELGEKKLIFASPERLKKYLGVEPGSVSPFNLIFDTERDVEIVIDKKLLEEERIGFHPNTNTATLVISSQDLKKFVCGLGYEPRTASLV